MSECRALTNFVGNGVATVGVSHWEKEIDRDRLASKLASPSHSHRHEEVATVEKVA